MGNKSYEVRILVKAYNVRDMKKTLIIKCTQLIEYPTFLCYFICKVISALMHSPLYNCYMYAVYMIIIFLTLYGFYWLTFVQNGWSEGG